MLAKVLAGTVFSMANVEEHALSWYFYSSLTQTFSVKRLFCIKMYFFTSYVLIWDENTERDGCEQTWVSAEAARESLPQNARGAPCGRSRDIDAESKSRGHHFHLQVRFVPKLLLLRNLWAVRCF